jgi:hypothetical protein
MSKYFDLKEAAATGAFGGNVHIAASDLIEEIERRQSHLVRSRVPLFLYGYTSSGTPFFADAWTIWISRNGASILMRPMVQAGQQIIATNKSNEATAVCRVVSVAPGLDGCTEVAIEFLTPIPELWPETSERPVAGDGSGGLPAPLAAQSLT